ncbi:MAG: SGNH/GDSL hydrolase family protein [Blautia sp.]|nr:SGNH/GDSL hydrolase family protein [Blautia sp.]
MKKWISLGDSITDCGRLFYYSPYGDGYVSLVERRLNPKPLWDVQNRGIDGFTLARVYQQLCQSPISPRPEDCSFLAVSLLVGINDVAMMMTTDRTQAQIHRMQEQFSALYDQLLKRLELEGCDRILVMEPFVFSWPAGLKTWQPCLREISRRIREAAGKNQKALFLPLWQKLEQAAEAEGVDQITTDGVHLTRKGHELLAEEVYRELMAAADDGSRNPFEAARR